MSRPTSTAGMFLMPKNAPSTRTEKPLDWHSLRVPSRTDSFDSWHHSEPPVRADSFDDWHWGEQHWSEQHWQGPGRGEWQMSELDPWAPPPWWKQQTQSPMPPPPPRPVNLEEKRRHEAEQLEKKERTAKVTQRVEARDWRGAMEAIRAVWAAGDELDSELALQVVSGAADAGGRDLAEVLKMLCNEASARRLKLNIAGFALMLEKLTLGLSYKPHIVRTLLNLALPRGSAPVPLEPPPDEFYSGRQSSLVGVVAEDEDDGEDDGKGLPSELVLRGGTARPDVEGSFQLTTDFDALLPSGKPVYRGGAASVFCYFWSFTAAKAVKKAGKKKAKKSAEEETEETREGWCMSSRIGASEDALLGFCPSSARLPPSSGWTMRRLGDEKALEPDACGFVQPLCAEMEVLSQLPPEPLMGSVHGLDETTTSYFGHFCALLHMEFLTEVSRLRARFSNRKGEVLQRGGWALLGLLAASAKGKGRGSKGKGKGKGKDGGQLLVLELPSNTNIERLRFKKQDSVIVSRSDPLVDTLGEGPVQELGNGQISILLRDVSEMPDDFMSRPWRVDKGANRLSYSRQLASLAALCTAPDAKQRVARPGVFELLTHAAVGEDVDMWAQKLSGKKMAAPPTIETAKPPTLPPVTKASPADVQPQGVAPATAAGEPGAMETSATNATAAEAAALSPGQVVRLKGLQRAELNGLEGVVAEIPTVEGGRVSVKMGDGEVKAVRPENLLTVGATALIGEPVVPAAATAPAAPAPPAAPAAPAVPTAPLATPMVPVAPTVASSTQATTVAPAGPAAPVAEVAQATVAPEQPIAERLASQLPQLELDSQKLEECRARLRAAPDLNPSQLAAVEATLGRSCTVIQGPPGTGKTTTAIYTLQSWVQLGITPLLATADGNVAVDNIAEGLVKRGVKVVRLGRPEKVQACLDSVTLDALMRERQQREKVEESDEAHRKRVDLLSTMSVSELLGRIRTYESSGGSAPAEPAEGLTASLEALLTATAKGELAAEQAQKAQEDAVLSSQKTESERAADEAAKRREAARSEMAMRLKIFKEAEVICTQMISAGGNTLTPLGPFQGMLIDEVGQATELTAIVPIVQRGCQRLVLAGDHCQLPPTVMSREAELRGLSVSLFGRLVSQGVLPYFLNTQFRSHPKLAEFSAEAIYDGKLQSGIEGKAREPVEGFDWPVKQVPVAFVETGPTAVESAEFESRYNEQEAQKLLEVLEGVLDSGDCTARDVGIITPYMAQVRVLRQAWRDLCSRKAKDAAAQEQKAEKKKRKAVAEPSAPEWWKMPRDLEIASVDHFQGREKELVLFSAVRNNNGGKVGFLSDWRRLNVMLTRARRGLVVIGNAYTLKHDRMWRFWLGWCRRHGVVIDQKDWIRTLRIALKEKVATPVARVLLKQLFVLDGAPRKPKAFRELLKNVASAEDLCYEVEDLKAAWAAVSAAREALLQEAQRELNEQPVEEPIAEASEGKGSVPEEPIAEASEVKGTVPEECGPAAEEGAKKKKKRKSVEQDLPDGTAQTVPAGKEAPAQAPRATKKRKRTTAA